MLEGQRQRKTSQPGPSIWAATNVEVKILYATDCKDLIANQFILHSIKVYHHCWATWNEKLVKHLCIWKSSKYVS